MSAETVPRVLIVVPAYNEAGNLPQVIADLGRHCPQWDVVVVDDGSKDHSAEVAQALGAVVLRLPFNLGIGGAVQTGLRYAEREGYDVCVQVDGDGQHKAEETQKLVQVLQATGADAVVGSRFLAASDFRSTLTRRIGITLLRLFLRGVMGGHVSDPTSGHRAFGRRAIVLLAGHYPQEYPEPEVLYILHCNRLRIEEIPVDMNPRRSGRSSIRALDSVLYMVKVVLAILIRATRGTTGGTDKETSS